jgi:hypothetical protein
MYIGGEKHSHVVALLPSRENIKFFDPNVGEYEIEPQKIEAFLGEWLSVIIVKLGFEVKKGCFDVYLPAI